VNTASGAVAHFIGLMSGTSLDGVDGVLCRWDETDHWQGVVAHVHRPFEADFQARLLALQASGADELHRVALAGNELARCYAEVVEHLLQQSALPAREVRAVGAHGQTVRHQPLAFDGVGYTSQINNPALLAERCGIDVIADFRSRDLAAGGQGAPLVPTFHRAVFGDPKHTIAVVNIGGISNLTLLQPGSAPRGWDVGPGNVLMDLWAARHLGRAYDDAGRWAASGRVLSGLLDALLAEPFLAQAPPKSTGRDLFHAGWLEGHLARNAMSAEPADVQATLCAYTARTIANDLLRQGLQVDELLVCGGGACNDELMRLLRQALPGVAVRTSSERGLPPLQVEAAAFAWLAHQHVHRQAASEPAVTGARGARILGACYPAY
jgi:anhydro-N-acetylmuramic acid kinase